MSRESRLKLLFEQDNPQRLARRLAYFDYLGRANRDRLDAYLADIRNLLNVQTALSRENLSLEESRQHLAERSAALSALQISRRQSRGHLDAEIGSSRRRIEEMYREREELGNR